MSFCGACGGAGYIGNGYSAAACPACRGTGQAQSGRLGGLYGGQIQAGAQPSKPAGPKKGELFAGRCKRCRGEALRVIKVELDKIELFCKLCGKEQEAKR